MKWLIIVMAVLGVLILLVLVTGLLLPREHQAASRLTIPKPIDQVWSQVRDMAAVAEFWPEVTKVERTDLEGREAWTQTLKNGFTMQLVIDEDHPPVRLVTRIVAPAGNPFGGRWYYELSSDRNEVELTITEDGWVSNPVFRVVSRIMGYHATLDSYLNALGRRLGTGGRPVHVAPVVTAGPKK